MSTSSASGGGFLKFNSLPPRVHLTYPSSSSPDAVISRLLHQEGFDVTFLPYPTAHASARKEGNGKEKGDDDATTEEKKQYRERLKHLADDLELGESYAVIAFGAAASFCLDFFSKPSPHCSAVIAYYPDILPPQKTKYPPHVNVLCHLTRELVGVGYPTYFYPRTRAGFAEVDKDEVYDPVAADLAWSRTLHVLRKALKVEVQLEGLVEVYAARQRGGGGGGGAAGVVGLMNADTDIEPPHVNYVPITGGGVGRRELMQFYREYFFAGGGKSRVNVQLVSRTMGVDRVVDEMVVSFVHASVMDWILPNVPPTHRAVHIPMVSIVCVRGGRLQHEHVYWDQASVLVQIGLIDPKVVPEKFQKRGLRHLPVSGADTAARVLDVESVESNSLIDEPAPPQKGDERNRPVRHPPVELKSKTEKRVEWD